MEGGRSGFGFRPEDLILRSWTEGRGSSRGADLVARAKAEGGCVVPSHVNKHVRACPSAPYCGRFGMESELNLEHLSCPDFVKKLVYWSFSSVRSFVRVRRNRTAATHPTVFMAPHSAIAGSNFPQNRVRFPLYRAQSVAFSKMRKSRPENNLGR